MVIISDAAKAALTSGGQKDIVLAFSNGRRVSGAGIVSESMSIEQTVCDDGQLSFGSTGSACLKVQITDTENRYMGLGVTATLVSGGETYQLGAFTVREDTLTDSRRYRNLVAYDALSDIYSKNVTPWYHALRFPMTLREFRNSFFAYCGVSEAPAVLVNDNARVEKTVETKAENLYRIDEVTTVYSGDLTGERVVRAICEMNGCVGFINHNGEFKYVTMDGLRTGEPTFTASKYVLGSLVYKEYETKAPTRLKMHFSSRDIGVIVGDDLSDSANTYHVVGNILASGDSMNTVSWEAMKRMAQNLYGAIKGTSYRPAKVSYQCMPWVEPGDVVSVPGERGPVAFPILRREIRGITALMETVSAEGDEEFSYDANSASDSLGQVGDSVTEYAPLFFRFVSGEAVTVADGASGEIVSLRYVTRGISHVEFIGQATVTAASAGDVVLSAAYVVDGETFAEYHTLNHMDSTAETITLYHAWEAPSAKGDGTFSVVLSVSGGSVTVPAHGARGRLMSARGDDSGVNAERSLDGIEVTVPPVKTEYRRGEALDFTGLVVTAIYTDGDEVDVTSQCSYSPAGGDLVTESSEIAVTVTYMEGGEAHETEFYLEVSDLAYIRVTPPTKTAYKVGELLDYTGLSVSAVYGDGSEEVVTQDCTISPAEGTAAPQSDPLTVTVTYGKDGETFTETFDLTVYWLSSLMVTRPPTKTTYGVGERLDYGGVVVMAEYTDGSSANVTGKCSFSPASGTEVTQPGTVTVTASYKEGAATVTDSFDVEVQPNVLVAIAVTNPPTVATYAVGNQISYSGVVITATYSNGTTADVTTACDFNPPDGSTASEVGNVPVEVSYTEDGVTETASFSVTVSPVPVTFTLTTATGNAEYGELVSVDGAVFSLVHTFEFEGEPGTIDSGELTTVEISGEFDTINRIDVEGDL